MKQTNQSWVRLGKNLSTLIIVVTIAIAFYVYTPHEENECSLVIDTLVEKDFVAIAVDSNSTGDTIVDPNTATELEFLRVGFSKKQALQCINYRRKGGRFYKKEDLRKIYSISEYDYKKLEPYIRIPVQKKKKQAEVPVRPEKEMQHLEAKTKDIIIKPVLLNTCDTSDLKLLPGIGTFRAKKIIEVRNQLGGFYSVNQLYSVYSIDSALVDKLRQYFVVDTSVIQKININTSSFKEINAHPLFTYEQTRRVVQYRAIVKTIVDPKELLKNGILTEKEFAILKFYIKTF